MKKLIILVLILIQVHIIVGQQPHVENSKCWIDAGIGNYSNFHNSGGLNWNTSLNFMQNKISYKIRYLNNEEFNIYGPSPTEKFKSGGFLIGKSILANYGHCSFLCGIGIVSGVKRGKLLNRDPNTIIGDGRQYERTSFTNVSIPLEVDLQYSPFKYFGIGTSLYCDLNLKSPMCGFLFKIALGKLR
jgi:hypothetical protein